MKFTLYWWGLVFCVMLVGLGSLLNCGGVTMVDLQAKNQKAATLEVPCRPSQFPDGINLWATRVSSGHVVTDERPDELLSYAEMAEVFIQYNASAPSENARMMRLKYGLACPSEMETPSESSETLRDEEPCSTQATAPADRQFVGDTNTQPCNPGAGGPPNGATGAAPAALPRIGVCTHPDGITSDEWYGGPGIKADVKTDEEHKAQVAKATVVFFFDKSAPPESIWHFGPNIKARCPGKAPMPYKDWVAQNAGASTQQAGTGTSGTGKQPSGTGTAGTGTAGTNTTAAPKTGTGSGRPSSTSSPNGQGPALSIFERLSRNMSLAGALAQGDTSGNAKDPNGHRNGIPSGQNVGGFSFPLLQASVATFQVISAVGLKPKDFIDIVNAASKKGQRTVIDKADKAALDLADDLIKNHGQYPMAQGLEEMQTIMPYEMASKFTKDLGNKFQAHKIFEKQALKRLKESEKGFEKLPSVILTDAEHKHVTKLLNDEWKKLPAKGTVTADQLRAIYKEAYKGYPHWQEIIEKQLRQLQ